MGDLPGAAAYGGEGWSPRLSGLREELVRYWRACGISNEWGRLRAVLLHKPGSEWDDIGNADEAQMLATPDTSRAREEHETLADAYRGLGIEVHYIAPASTPPPNLLFAADLFLMTPEGAIVGRPASTVRAGEERWVAARLAELGVPILRTVQGRGTFEGADAMWLDENTVLLGCGLRSNAEGTAQVTTILNAMGVEVIQVDLPLGTMHLMGQLRIVDRDLAILWPYRLAYRAVDALRERGYRLLVIPDEEEATRDMALNVVTIGPREILVPSGAPRTRAFYEDHGIRCHSVPITELAKAAGGIGCMTGILHRE